MTAQIVYRMAAFREGSRPSAKSLPDSLIVVHSVDGTQATLLISNGEDWLPVGLQPEVASLAQAIEGTDNETVITPLRLRQVLENYGLVGGPGSNGYVDAGYVDAGYVD